MIHCILQLQKIRVLTLFFTISSANKTNTKNFDSYILKGKTIINFESDHLTQQNLKRNRIILKRILTGLKQVFYFRISFYDLFQKQDIENRIYYFFTFFIPEKSNIELENIIDADSGQKTLDIYNEYIYNYNLQQMMFEEMKSQQQILDQLKLINKSISVYDEVVKQEQHIRELEQQISNVSNKIAKIECNFFSESLNLLPLPGKDKKIYFILPIKGFNIKRLLHYINYSPAVQKTYYNLKEANENIHTNLSLQTTIDRNGQPLDMEARYNPNLYLLELATIQVMSYSLRIDYYRTFARVKNAYTMLLSLKQLLLHEKKYLLFTEEKIQELLKTKNTNFILRVFHLQRKAWSIRKKILELQKKQTHYVGVIACNLVPLNQLKYMYFYKVYNDL